MSRTADARIIARAVLYAPSAFNRELGGEVMADCEAFTAPAQSHCSGRVIAVGDRGIEPIAARRGRRVHRLSRDALPCRPQAHFASAAETPPHSESHPCGAIVIAVVITEFLSRERIEQRRDNGRIRDVADLPVRGQLDAV